MNNIQKENCIEINQTFFEENFIKDYVYYKNDFEQDEELKSTKIFNLVKEEKENTIKNKYKSFIEKYFVYAEKVIPKNLDLKQLSDYRTKHTLYVYFLGAILIQKGIFKNIKNIMGKNEDVLYYWFLVALFHDFGYTIEENSIKYLINKLDLFYPLQNNENYFNKFHITYALFDHKFISKNSYINSIEKCSLYKFKTFRNYYNYCIEQLNFLEHGILGGILLYDFLCKNYYEKSKGKLKDFSSNGKEFKKTDFDIYAYCAYSIAQHNMWRINDLITIPKYLAYGLDELIGTDKKFNINKNPFSFLLGLVDTMEITKRNIDFKDINIVFDKEQNSIEFIFKDMKNKKEIKEQHLNTIEKLSNWLDVKTDKQIKSVKIKIL